MISLTDEQVRSHKEERFLTRIPVLDAAEAAAVDMELKAGRLLSGVDSISVSGLSGYTMGL